jgi:hypothetical protein
VQTFSECQQDGIQLSPHTAPIVDNLYRQTVEQHKLVLGVYTIPFFQSTRYYTQRHDNVCSVSPNGTNVWMQVGPACRARAVIFRMARSPVAPAVAQLDITGTLFPDFAAFPTSQNQILKATSVTVNITGNSADETQRSAVAALVEQLNGDCPCTQSSPV